MQRISTCITVLAGVVMATEPAPAPAQAVVQGVVVSEDEQRAISGARVVLVRDDGTAVDSARTTSIGRYRLEADGAGTFVLHTEIRGYASYTSAPFRLAAGDTLDRRIELPLVSVRAMQIMADVIGSDTMLQQDLPTLCGEDLRPWESGIVVGVIRDRYTRDPIPGALVMIVPDEEGARPLTTLANDRGTYILCNVPLGESPLRVRADGWRPRQVTVEVRAGMIGWYDVFLYPGSSSSSRSSSSTSPARVVPSGSAPPPSSLHGP